MTAVLDRHPDAGQPAWAALGELQTVIAALAVSVAEVPLAPADYARLIAETQRAICRLEAVKLSLISVADKASVAVVSGMSGTGAWLSRHTRTTGSVAAGQVALAGALEDLPATGAALAQGEMSAEHAAVIAAATRRLPAGLDHGQRSAVEDRLVAQAKALDPAALRKRARRALEEITSREEADRHHDHVLREEEATARAKTRLTLHDKTAATIVVTLDQRQLTADLAAAGVDTGEEISASEARRLACSAGILPAILGGQSQVLDLGRTQRFFTEAQRVALAIRHTTCAADGCDRPYAWTELHHRNPWGRGGRTDLDNAVPLCGFHHRRIHDPAYLSRLRPDGSFTVHQRR